VIQIRRGIGLGHNHNNVRTCAHYKWRHFCHSCHLSSFPSSHHGHIVAVRSRTIVRSFAASPRPAHSFSCLPLFFCLPSLLPACRVALGVSPARLCPALLVGPLRQSAMPRPQPTRRAPVALPQGTLPPLDGVLPLRPLTTALGPPGLRVKRELRVASALPPSRPTPPLPLAPTRLGPPRDRTTYCRHLIPCPLALPPAPALTHVWRA
jgi:hypothetical protein